MKVQQSVNPCPIGSNRLLHERIGYNKLLSGDNFIITALPGADLTDSVTRTQ